MENYNQFNESRHRILVCIMALVVSIGFVYDFCSKRFSEAGDIIDEGVKQILDNPKPLIYTPRPRGEALYIVSQPQGTNRLVASAHYSNRVLITSEDEMSHNTSLWICSIDGTYRTQVIPDDGTLAMGGQWSYDDKYIIYVSYNPGNKTYSLNAFDEAAKTIRKIVDGGVEMFSVSPVANELVYVPNAAGRPNPNRTVRIVSFNDSQSDTMLYEITGPNVVSGISWKPDGKYVSVLQAHYEEGAGLRCNLDIYLIDPATKKNTRLDLLGNFFKGLDGEEKCHGSFQWSPTGHILLSLRNTYIIEPDGQSWKKIIPDGAESAVWSSDYSKILFSTYQIDRMEHNIYWIPSNIGTSN